MIISRKPRLNQFFSKNEVFIIKNNNELSDYQYGREKK